MISNFSKSNQLSKGGQPRPSAYRIFAKTFPMILYNVTVSIDEDVHEEWLRWMMDVHIPDVLATGMFLENKICRIHAFEEGGITYSIQYLAPDQASFDRYQSEFAPALQDAHTRKYAGKFAAFRTVLEVLSHTKA